MKFSISITTLRLIAAVFAFAGGLHAAPREWTDQSTGRKITAEFVSVLADQVTLSINGKEYKLPVSRLSADDQAYLRIVGDASAPAEMAKSEVTEMPKTTSVPAKVMGPVDAGGSTYYYYIPTTLAPGTKAPVLLYTGAGGGDANTVKGMIEGAEICGWIAATNVESKNGADYPVNLAHIERSVKGLIANQPVDPAGLYFSGHSGGARMAFHANKNLNGKGVLGYIAGAEDDEISRAHRYFIVSGATDYNRYDTATTFADARKNSAYRMHTEGHTNGPSWLMTEGMVWLQAMAYVDAKETGPRREAFEGRVIEWIEKTKGTASYRAAWWARHFKTIGVSPKHSSKVAALDSELSASAENAAYIKGIGDIEDFAEGILAKVSEGSLKGHTTPEIQKKCDKMLADHATTPWIKDVLAALKNKTGG
jgi:predicted esterase